VGGWFVGACGALAVGGLVIGFEVDRFDAEHPEPTKLAYALDAGSGEAFWVSDEATPSEWTSRYVDARSDLSQAFPGFHGEVWAGDATGTDLPAPELEVIADETSGAERTVELTVRPGVGAPVGTAGALRYIELSSAHGSANVISASLVGRKIPVGDDGVLDTRYYTPTAGGFQVVVTVPAGEEVRLRIIAAGGGLEDLP
jgi:hypothetical protein